MTDLEEQIKVLEVLKAFKPLGEISTDNPSSELLRGELTLHESETRHWIFFRHAHSATNSRIGQDKARHQLIKTNSLFNPKYLLNNTNELSIEPNNGKYVLKGKHAYLYESLESGKFWLRKEVEDFDFGGHIENWGRVLFCLPHGIDLILYMKVGDDLVRASIDTLGIPETFTQVVKNNSVYEEQVFSRYFFKYKGNLYKIQDGLVTAADHPTLEKSWTRVEEGEKVLELYPEVLDV